MISRIDKEIGAGNVAAVSARFYAQAGTPADVIARLSDELKKALALPAVQERFGTQGFAATWTSPAQTADYVANEVDKWRAVAQRSGAKVD